MKELIMWGAKTQVVVLEEFLSQEYKLVCLFDNDKEATSPIEGVSVKHGEKGLDEWLKDKDPSKIHFITAIGGGLEKVRAEISSMLKNKGLVPVTAIHPSAYVSKNAKIGESCQILAGSVIGAQAIIEDCVVVNTSASVDHDCVLRKGAHISPGATLAGIVEVGEYSFIGTGASVLPRISIGKNTIVGAGAVVTKDLPDNIVAYGVPAKIIRENDQS